MKLLSVLLAVLLNLLIPAAKTGLLFQEFQMNYPNMDLSHTIGSLIVGT